MLSLNATGMLKQMPGYKAILKAVLKAQIQMLVDQLSSETDEESVILTASLTDGTLSHLGSASGKHFLEGQEEFKTHFLCHCLRGNQRKRYGKGDSDNAGNQACQNPSSPEPQKIVTASKKKRACQMLPKSPAHAVKRQRTSIPTPLPPLICHGENQHCTSRSTDFSDCPTFDMTMTESSRNETVFLPDVVKVKSEGTESDNREIDNLVESYTETLGEELLGTTHDIINKGAVVTKTVSDSGENYIQNKAAKASSEVELNENLVVEQNVSESVMDQSETINDMVSEVGNPGEDFTIIKTEQEDEHEDNNDGDGVVPYGSQEVTGTEERVWAGVGTGVTTGSRHEGAIKRYQRNHSSSEKKKYRPKTRPGLDFVEYLEIGTGQEVPDGYQLLAPGSTIAVKTMWLHNTLSSLNRSHERRLSKAEVAIVKGSNPVRIYDLDSETIKRLMDGFYDPWDLAVDGGTGAFENNPVFKSLKDFWREVGLQSKYDMPHCSDINQQQFIGINPVALKYREPGRRYHGVEDCSQDFSHFFKPGEGMIKLVEGRNLYINAKTLSVLRDKCKNKDSKMIKSLLDYYFDRAYQASHSVRGEKTDKPALPNSIVEAIKEYTFLEFATDPCTYNSMITRKLLDSKKSLNQIPKIKLSAEYRPLYVQLHDQQETPRF